MSVRTTFFQAVPRGLGFRPMIFGGGIVVDESCLLGSLILVIPVI